MPQEEAGMRAAIAMCVTLALTGAAMAQTGKPGGPSPDRVLSPVEVVAAFDGRVLCGRETQDAQACDSITEPLSASETQLRFRDTGIIGLAELREPAFAEFVGTIEAVRRYSALFDALEEQREAGNFQYVRLVETSEYVFNPNLGRWCQPPEQDLNLGNLHAAFVRDTSAASDAEPFSPTAMQELRSFLRELVVDPAIIEMTEQDAELRLLLQTLVGEERPCLTYFGTGAPSRPTITRIQSDTEEGVRLPSLDGDVTMHATLDGLRLEP
jgi:hypothetical protein